MKLFITDINTPIGRYLKDYFEGEYSVYNFDENEINLLHKIEIYKILKSIKPDVIIHTASIEDLNFCEKHEAEAYKINTVESLNIAHNCNMLDIPIIYISTSFVYDGKKNTPYVESDSCHPLNVYGKTKLAAEQLIKTLCKKYFIIRTSWIFGGYDCFIEEMLLKKRLLPNIYYNQIGNPTYIIDLCSCIKKMISSNLYGTYHYGSSNFTSKLNLIKSALNYADIKSDNLQPIENNHICHAALPKYAALNTDLIQKSFHLKSVDWNKRLKEYIKTLKS